MNSRSCILTGVDLGPDTEKNIAYAACFASAAGAAVRLLYIIDYLLTPPTYLSTYIEEEKKREEREMERLQAMLNGAGVRSEFTVMMGRLHESFLKVIRETAADMLVIGYRSHILRPSSSERLIKSLSLPMLVVRGKQADKASPGTVAIRKILCPVDFSENSLKALSVAKGYAGLFSADLHVLHVIPSHMLKARWEQWGAPREKDRERLEEDLFSEAAAELARLNKEFNIPGAGEIRQGVPGSLICAVADEGAYDMVVMGARGLSYLEGLLLGSTTESVLKASPCPVLIIH